MKCRGWNTFPTFGLMLLENKRRNKGSDIGQFGTVDFEWWMMGKAFPWSFHKAFKWSALWQARQPNSSLPTKNKSLLPPLNPEHILPTTTKKPTMVPQTKALVFILILIFGSSFSGEQVLIVTSIQFPESIFQVIFNLLSSLIGLADGFKDRTKLPYPNSLVTYSHTCYIHLSVYFNLCINFGWPSHWAWESQWLPYLCRQKCMSLSRKTPDTAY